MEISRERRGFGSAWNAQPIQIQAEARRLPGRLLDPQSLARAVQLLWLRRQDADADDVDLVARPNTPAHRQFNRPTLGPQSVINAKREASCAI